MASNVPKFASFRPKPKPASEPPKEVQKVKDVERLPKDTTRRERRKSPQHENQRHARDSQPSKLYFSDRRSDTDILKYGTINRYDVPAYRRCGHGHVLGLSTDQKIDRETSTDKKIYITPATRQRQERLLTAKHVPKESSRALRFIKPAEHQPVQDRDFISLSSTNKRKRDDDEAEDDEAPDVDYRGIERHDKSSELIDPDTLYESDSQTTGVGAEVTRQNSRLVRRTREHPEDLEGWLDFIHHQEPMMMLDRASAELSETDKRHLAEVRVPIYEEALKKIGNNQDSQVRLYEGLLNEARRSWDDARLAIKWKDVLAKYPYSTPLWFDYLNFMQSSFARFKYEDSRIAFLKCLETLRLSPKGVSPEISLHVLVRLTSMIHGAGYQELALAIWQALLEFHLLRPPQNTGTKVQDALQSFEDFWESEVPRIGEPQAKGWRRFNSEDDPPPGPAPLQKKIASDAVFEDFQKRESEAMLNLRYPGRTADDVAEDDPFHTIFFSDVQEYLSIVPSTTDASLILEAFLCFCGLPSLPRVGSHQWKWWSDPYLQHTLPSSPTDIDDSSPFVQTLRHFSDCPSKSLQMTSSLLFEQDFSLEGINLSTSFIQRLLKLVASDPSSDAIIGEYLLAFTSRHFPSDIPKIAKQLLKTRSSSLRLYNAYGLAESHRGNVTKADQVFSMALSMHKGDPTQDSLQLLYSWVWSAMDKNEPTEAYWRLVSPQGSPTQPARTTQPDSTTILRAHTLFTETTQRALIQRNHPTAILSTSLLALLTYISTPNPQSALAHHTSLLPSLPPPHQESLAQSLARLLTHHALHAPILKATLLRTALDPLIALFPNNTILLPLYAANEARFAIDDRVRSVMRRPNAQNLSTAGWAFAIHYEALRGERGGSTSHAVRALYGRATGSGGAACPALWMAYVRFETGQLELERGKWARGDGKEGAGRVREAEQRVRSTVYAGLRRVPWCKAFITHAFTHCSRVFTDEEKARLYGVMQEKEFRLYIDIDVETV
ncbi:DUF1740-domain-containing protein [Dothidotthia symphoricarpi CBS 119687]|uniref:DUF1740-domain-containing protein n=1 Tax=Dothidotthia symphoricarpi CBS 119687 TaxID=1392245 RepID=A0A6A5ZXZ3_9PLEO|nr:DUF1740-domain-containing protein [Dothidotthia symphoricarpi CBS 119687]KAF2124642.1 DUF1740-domain-containing protein [Dothidotthia symphoricarpi CBS 119687]